MTHVQIGEQDISDRYLMRKLSEEMEAEFVEHYLACPECVERLEVGRETIAAVREASARGQAQQFVAGRRERRFIPAPAWGLAVLLVVAGVWVGVLRRSAPKPPESPSGKQSRPVAESGAAAALPVVTLESYRAGAVAGSKLAAATAAKAFLLRLDLRGLQSYDQYTVEIVGDAGARAWSKDGIVPSGDAVEVKVESAPLVPGAFWVRLRGRRADGGAEFLREYSLQVE